MLWKWNVTPGVNMTLVLFCSLIYASTPVFYAIFVSKAFYVDLETFYLLKRREIPTNTDKKMICIPKPSFPCLPSSFFQFIRPTNFFHACRHRWPVGWYFDLTGHWGRNKWTYFYSLTQYILYSCFAIFNSKVRANWNSFD